MRKSVFHVSKMDCPSEERVIRMALEGQAQIMSLSFDLQNRDLTAIHASEPEEVLALLQPLNFGAGLTVSSELSEMEEVLLSSSNISDTEEMGVLKKVFAINAVMFAIGLIGGWIAQSTGLIADSLDMFADAAVFGLSMYAVGRSQLHKKKAARLSGYLQMLLAVFALSEVVRRFVVGSEPEAPYMIVLASIALIANATCMYLLAKHRDGEVHMRASWIFLSNDVVANFGVILAGILVKFTASQVPDLLIGTIIGAVVLSGAVRILRAAR